MAGWLLWKQIGVKGRPKAENYGRGPWQEGLRNSTLYITLVALQCKYILVQSACRRESVIGNVKELATAVGRNI